jgi:hypothetical protein
MAVDWSAIGGPDELEVGDYRVRVLRWDRVSSPLTYRVEFGSSDVGMHTEEFPIGTTEDPEGARPRTWAISAGGPRFKQLFQALGFDPLWDPEGMLERARTEGRYVVLHRVPRPMGGVTSRFASERVQPAPPAPAVSLRPEQFLPGPPAHGERPAVVTPPAESPPQVMIALGGTATVQAVPPPPVRCPFCAQSVPRPAWAAHLAVHEAAEEEAEE